MNNLISNRDNIFVYPLFTFGQFSVFWKQEFQNSWTLTTKEKKNALKKPLTEIKLANAHALKCQSNIFVFFSFCVYGEERFVARGSEEIFQMLNPLWQF